MKMLFLIAIFFCLNTAMASTLTYSDKVRTVSEEKDSYQVTFWTKAAFYHIKKTNPEGHKIVTGFKTSLGKKQTVKFNVDPNTLEVKSLVK